jgi:hypothetical protein
MNGETNEEERFDGVAERRAKGRSDQREQPDRTSIVVRVDPIVLSRRPASQADRRTALTRQTADGCRTRVLSSPFFLRFLRCSVCESVPSVSSVSSRVRKPQSALHITR